MNNICVNCDHCVKRHQKELLNTSGRFVCLVLGSLIPDPIPENGTMCTGLYFDEKIKTDADEVITVNEACEILGLSRQRVSALLKNGKLDGRKSGKNWMVYKQSVERRAAR